MALGFLIPPVVIKGPVKTFRDIISPQNRTFNGSFPQHWRDEKWGNASDSAVSEVTSQVNFLNVRFAAFCSILFFLIVLVFEDRPPKPPSKASLERFVITIDIFC